MKLKNLIASMCVLGFIGTTAFAAEQRADLSALRDRAAQPKAELQKGGNWFEQHIKINGQINADAGISDKTRTDSNNPSRYGPYDIFSTMYNGNKSSSDIYLRNSNIKMDIMPTDWISARIEITGQDSYSRTMNVSQGGRAFSYLNLQEAYVTLGNLASNPFYLSAGQEFIPFGYYSDVNPLTYSLTQELTQINETMVGVGYAQPMGFSAMGYIFRSRVSPAPTVDGSGLLNTGSNVNNGGVDVGYNWADSAKRTGFDVGIGWVNNLVDTRAIMPVVWNAAGSGTYARSVGGISAHVGGFWNQFDVSGTYVGSLKSWDASDVMWRAATTGAKPSAFDVGAGYSFTAFARDNHLGLGYQQSMQSSALGIPQRRYQVDWTINLYKSTNLQFQYTRDSDYSVADGGTGMNANTGKVRLSVGFL